MASMGMHMLTGDAPQILLDKLAERLAMERRHQAMIRTWYEEAVGVAGLDAARAPHNAGSAIGTGRSGGAPGTVS